MITNNFRLESGHEYSLKQLFNGKNRIVIPDLQRDYCWGDKAWNKDENNYTELVSGFLDSVLSFFNENPNDKLMLGLIYGYENPHFTIQLCDGQQRLTTLFLLAGMINKKTEENHFKEILISEAELADDRETNLQYAIRESTLYFLSDLVCEFFLKKDVSVEDIKNKDWYFKEYDLDASIQSMLSAVKTIDTKLINVNCKAFGEFIINNLQMLYYDMGHRTRGEETFVVINTTGEPLTATENLKPILIGNIQDKIKRKEASEEWEDREDWFWQNKRGHEPTSDNALNDFFIWYWQIRLLQEKSWKDKKPYPLNPNELFQKKPIVLKEQEENPDIDKWEESKNLDTVHKYFIALNLLIDNCKDDNIARVLKTIHNEDISLSWFRKVDLNLITLPLIAYVEKFKDKNLYQFVRRIRKNYFDNILNERKTNYIDWRLIIKIIEFSNTEEEVLKFETKINIVKFKKISNVLLNEWYNQDEKQKDILKIDHKSEVEQWEDHDELNGDLFILWRVNGDDNLDFIKISQDYQSFETLSNCLTKNKSITNPILSNYFRLYKLLIGYPAVGHIYNCSWDMEGAWFSWRNVNSNDFLKYLYDEKIISLIKVGFTKLNEELVKRIRLIANDEGFMDLNDTNFKVSKHLKAWLFIKVLQANSKNQLVAFYDGSGIASYTNCKKNKLNSDIDFSLANSICGYAIKNPANRIDYSGQEHWSKPYAIDTIIGESICYDEFKNRIEEPVPKEKIERIDELIKSLFNSFMTN